MIGSAVAASPRARLDSGTLRRSRKPGLLARHAEWPVTALLVGYPLWWALGIANFSWIILAVPMISRMMAWRTFGRRLKLPPAFGLWLLFLICAIAGFAVLTLTAPGTVSSPVSHRVISYGVRNLTYVGVTVLLLYVGNLTEAELPRRRLAWMLGLVAIVTTVGGIAGMLKPHLQFSSPFLLALPKSIQANPFIQASMHPGLAQVQNVLGSAKGRPKAPFDYTNLWADCLTILIPWLLVAAFSGGTRRQRWIAGAVVTAAIAPLLYSLNRAAWMGVAISLGYLAVRFAAKGKTAMIGGLILATGLAAVLILLTPLHAVITGRLANGKSDNLRSNLAALSIEDALASPVIGYGDTRQERGSPTSIAVGPTVKCPSCGQLAVGSTGQLWLLLICNGFVGAAFYLGFFGYGIWYFWRDGSAYGIAGVLVLLLSFAYMFAYDAVGAPLGFTMLSYGLVWKNGTSRVESDATRPNPRLRAAQAG